MKSIKGPRNKVSKQTKGRGANEATLDAENKQSYGDITVIPLEFSRKTLADSIYRFRRTSTSADVSQLAASDNSGGYAFVLSNVPGYTEYTALFDQYKIEMVRVIWRPRWNFSAIGSIATDVNPLFISVIDYDDASTLTIAQSLEYQSYKETRFDQDHVRCIKPRIALGAYSGTFTSFANVPAPWIDCASPSVQHYGIKFVVSGGALGQTALMTYSAEVEYFVKFRQVR
jgi:hypothetical protein